MIIVLLLAFAGFVHAKEVNLKVDSRVPYYKLIPENFGSPSKTTWNLKSVEGSKLIFNCRTEGSDCSEVRMLVSDDNINANVCTEWGDERVVMDGNTGKLMIDTKGTSYAVYCNVTATKSYLIGDEKSIESDEDGTAIENKPTCPCGWANKDSGRIVGGKETLKNEFPFAVLIGVRGDERPDCGGSILTPHHVITAAHCTYGRLNLEVTVGDHKISDKTETDVTKVYPVEEVIMHDDYDSNTLQYDIAILYIKNAIEFSKYVGPVCMPDRNRTLVGDHIKVMGWGKNQYRYRIASDVLMKANLRVVDLDVCRKIFPSNIVRGHTQICTYHSRKDSCSGDSGGPVVWLNKDTNMFTQYGVVSFGNSCNTTDPAVNTNLFYYLGWIQQQIKATHDHKLCY